MIVIDTTFVLDYLDGVEATAAFLRRHEDRPFGIPSIVAFETYRGAAIAQGPDGIDRVVTALEWLRPLALTEPVAREAATIEAEVADRGEPINLADTLVAGHCRHHDAPIVTRDGDLERVHGVSVQTY